MLQLLPTLFDPKIDKSSFHCFLLILLLPRRDCDSMWVTANLWFICTVSLNSVVATHLTAFTPCGLCSARSRPCSAAASVTSPSKTLLIPSLASFVNMRNKLDAREPAHGMSPGKQGVLESTLQTRRGPTLAFAVRVIMLLPLLCLFRCIWLVGGDALRTQWRRRREARHLIADGPGASFHAGSVTARASTQSPCHGPL